MFDTHKTRMIGLLFMVKKLRRCVKQTPERDRQTDGQTELLYQFHADAR